MLEQTMTKSHLQKSFVEAGMIDDKTNFFPTFNGLMATCKRWGSDLKNVGVSLATKLHVKEQLQFLARLQLDMGQVTYPDMHAVGIPRG
jgi:hypothetical protein